MNEWEEELIAAMQRVTHLIHQHPNAPQSDNMKIVSQKLMDARLRLAFQTGNYDKWGI